jgi:hypothetical protein
MVSTCVLRVKIGMRRRAINFDARASISSTVTTAIRFNGEPGQVSSFFNQMCDLKACLNLKPIVGGVHHAITNIRMDFVLLDVREKELFVKRLLEERVKPAKEGVLVLIRKVGTIKETGETGRATGSR